MHLIGNLYDQSVVLNHFLLKRTIGEKDDGTLTWADNTIRICQ